jgi:hypothetical protein
LKSFKIVGVQCYKLLELYPIDYGMTSNVIFRIKREFP